MQDDKEKFKKDFIKRLIRLSIETIRFGELLRDDRVIWVIIDQLIKSITSIGANVVEAKSSSSRRDYIKYFEIALKSANESKYWLIIIKQLYPSRIEIIDKLLGEVDEVSRIIGASILTLKGKK